MNIKRIFPNQILLYRLELLLISRHNPTGIMQIINVRPIVVPAGHAILLQKVFDFHLTATCFISIQGLSFAIFIGILLCLLVMWSSCTQWNLVWKISHILPFSRSLYSLMLIGYVVQLYTMEPGVENIAYSSL